MPLQRYLLWFEQVEQEAEAVRPPETLTESTTEVSSRKSRLAAANVELAMEVERLGIEIMDRREKARADSRKIKKYNALLYVKEKLKVHLMVNVCMNMLKYQHDIVKKTRDGKE